MNDRIILDLCGGTGSWSKPYIDAGYDVRLVTLPDNDVLTYHPPKGVYGVLAAPPCTMFSVARTTAKEPRDLEGAYALVQACLRIVAECQYEGDWLKFWALENPRGYLQRFLGKPTLRFEHWQFDPTATHCKPTDLWGYFNEPKWALNQRPAIFQSTDRAKTKWASPHAPKEYEHMKLDRAAIRAITPPGFAKAFFEANR